MSVYSQVPQNLDVTLTSTDDWNMLLTFTLNTVAINLSSYTINAYILDEEGTSTSITVTNTDLVNGQITLSLSKTQIGAMSIKQYVWYLVWTTNLGETRSILSGSFNIKTIPQTV